jgi:hypothetical protein
MPRRARWASWRVTSVVPSESTIRRLRRKLAADRLDVVIGAWIWLRTSMIRPAGDLYRRQGGTWCICWPGCVNAPDSRSAGSR